MYYLLCLFLFVFCSPLVAQAAIPSAASNHADYAYGYLHCDLYPNVAANSTAAATTNTTQFNICIDDAFLNNLTAYWACGTYYINDMLYHYEWNNWVNGKMEGVDSRAQNMRGAHGCGGSATGKPVLKLVSGATAFNNGSTPKPMVHTRGFDADSAAATPANAMPSAWDQTPTGYAAGTGRHLFDMTLENFTLDTNNNPGAICFSWETGQMTGVYDINCIATGSWGGAYGTPGRNGVVVNLTVTGGQHCVTAGPVYGLDLNESSGTTLVGTRCLGQTGDAINYDGGYPDVFVGLEITKSVNTGNPIVVNNLIVVQDATITLTGAAATANMLAIKNASEKSLYLRNVYISGTTDLIKNGTAATVTGTGTWKRFREYAFADHYNADGVPTTTIYPTYTAGTNQFETRSVINGVLDNAATPIITKDNNASAPPSDLLSRHTWTSLPSISDGAFTTPEGRNGCTPTIVTGRGNGSEDGGSTTGSDCLAGLNSAIAAAASAGHNRVHLPRGVIAVSGPVNLLKDTHIMGSRSGAGTGVVWKSTWTPIVETYFFTTDNDTTDTGTGSLSFFNMVARSVPYANRFIGYWHWRLGKNSKTVGLSYYGEYPGSEGQAGNSQNVKAIRFSGHGGGRHYGNHDVNGYMDSNLNYRQIYIEGTSQPLSLYGQNVESTKAGTRADANIEIKNASNVRIFGCKREGTSPTLIVDNSSNVAMYGCGAMRDPLAGLVDDKPAYEWVKGAAANLKGVLFAVIAPSHIAQVATQAERGMIQETITGTSPIHSGVPWPNRLIYYRRGTAAEVNDDVFAETAPPLAAPAYESAVIPAGAPNTMDMCWTIFDATAMLPAPPTNATGFTVTVDSVTKAATSIVRQGLNCYHFIFDSGTITTDSQVVLVSYNPGTGNVTAGGAGTPAATAFTNEQAENRLSPAAAPVFSQTAFAFRSLYGAADSPEWYENPSGTFENVSVQFIQGAHFRLYMKMANNNADALPRSFTIYWEKNESGTYAPLTDDCSTNETCFTDAADLGDGEATVELLTPTESTFCKGYFVEHAATQPPRTLPQNSETAIEAGIRIVSSAAVGSRFRYRIYKSDGTPLDSYPYTPLVTVIASRGVNVGGGRTQ